MKLILTINIIKMDHVVYLDAKAKEFEKLLDKSKTMIIRSATGRKIPYGIVSKNDVLYFINNNSEGLVKLKGVVLNVFNSDKMIQDESVNLVKSNQDKLCLTDKQFERWAGKRYIVLIEVKNIEKINPFKIDKRNYSNMDDWLPVTKIEDVMVN